MDTSQYKWLFSSVGGEKKKMRRNNKLIAYDEAIQIYILLRMIELRYSNQYENKILTKIAKNEGANRIIL